MNTRKSTHAAGFNRRPRLPRGEARRRAARRLPATSFNPRPRLPRGEASWGRSCTPHDACFNPRPRLPRGEAIDTVRHPRPPGCFNPRPRLPRGEARQPGRRGAIQAGFNPRPRLPRGEARVGVGHHQGRLVSIHAPGCPGAKRFTVRAGLCDNRFQSTPPVAQGRSPDALLKLMPSQEVSIHAPVAQGRSRAGSWPLPALRRFQSTPPVAQGRSPWSGRSSSSRAACFNPRPRLPRGEARRLHRPRVLQGQVSIHAPGCPGAKRLMSSAMTD